MLLCYHVDDAVAMVTVVKVRTVSHDTSQLRRVLYTVKALVTNHFLYLQPKPYVRKLLQVD